MEQTGGKGDHDSRLMRDLCTLLVTIIAPVAAASSVDSPRGAVARRPRGGMSPAGAASMLLGASMALMLCGSVTFAIGFLLMPWVAGVALLFGFAGVISTLSSGLLPSSSPCSSKDKEQRVLMPTQGRVRGSAPPMTMSSVPDKLVALR